MATVPVKINMANFVGSRFYCTRHENDVEYEPYQKAEEPIDTVNCICPGLTAELKALAAATEEELKVAFANQFYGNEAGMREKLRAEGLSDDQPIHPATRESLIEDADDECRLSWQLIIDLEDASVEVG